MSDDEELINIIHAAIEGADCPYEELSWCPWHASALRVIEEVRAKGWDFFSAEAVTSIIRERDRLTAELDEVKRERDALDRVRALHNGYHLCTDGSWWTNDDLYGGAVARKGECPTLAALDEQPEQGQADA